MNIREAVKYVFLSPPLFVIFFYTVLIGGGIFFPLLVWYSSWESPVRPYATMLGFVALSIVCAYASLKVSFRILKKKPDSDYRKIALIFAPLILIGGLLLAQTVSYYGSPIADLIVIQTGLEQGYSLSTMLASPAIFSLVLLPIALILSFVGYIFLRAKSVEI